MNESDRHRWDMRYSSRRPAPLDDRFPLPVFAGCTDHFPSRGHCLEIACGQGRAAIWLARRGMVVHGVDLSPVAIAHARELAASAGLGDRCHFDVFDLDSGLPSGLPADLILCHNFRDARLYSAMIDRLAPGGILAIATLSEVDAEPGRFRAGRGELRQAFAELEILGGGEKAGQAWLVGRQRRVS